MKNILRRCIPFIKFNDLTSNEFYNNVFPYKKILPKELREELIDYFLNPESNKPETKESQKIEEIKEIKFLKIKSLKIKSTNICSKIITFN